MSYLEIIMGPMFSGKTEMLINIYNTYSLISKPHNILLSTTFCIAFNYHKDTRYGENIIASHNKKSIPSINIEFLSLQLLELQSSWISPIKIYFL